MRTKLPISVTIVLAVAALCAGCRTVPRQPATSVYDGPLPQLEVGEAPPQVSPGSLFTDAGSSALVSDFRARHVGDVLTVRILESSLGKSSADSKLDRNAKMKLEAPSVLGFETDWANHWGTNFDPSNALDTTTTKSFEGTGETSRSSTLSGTIAVRVLAVGTDGRLLIAGSKEIVVNKERQKLTLAGIVRAEDIGPTNAIGSSSIADLSIHYGGTGDVADNARQGWLARLLTKIWPF